MSEVKCPNLGCNMTFKFHMERKHHLDRGKCKGQPQKKPSNILENVTSVSRVPHHDFLVGKKQRDRSVKMTSYFLNC